MLCCNNPIPSSFIAFSFQSALVRQLQDHLCLRQQQSSGLMHGDVFENVQGAKSSLPLLRTRLKQAAFCIARLSREKQQLIEMGNHLRAQITTAGLHGTITDTLHHHCTHYIKDVQC